MLNALPSQTKAAGQPASLLPNLAAEPATQRAATEARQGFAALMQQQADLHLADLRVADLKAASSRRADAAWERPHGNENRSTELPKAQPAAPERTTRRAEPAQAADDAPARSQDAGRPNAADQPTRAAQARQPDGTRREAVPAQDARTHAKADGSADPAKAPEEAATEAAVPRKLPKLTTAVEQALADEAAETALPAALLRPRMAGRAGNPAGDDLPVRRLPRTTAADTPGSAARLPTTVITQPMGDAGQAPLAEADPLSAAPLDQAMAEPDLPQAMPEITPLQPWLQAQAMVTQWRPVGDGTEAAPDALPGAGIAGSDTHTPADPLALKPVLQTARPADLQPATGAPSSLTSQAPAATDGDKRTQDLVEPLVAATSADPALASAMAANALTAGQALRPVATDPVPLHSAVRQASGTGPGHRANWRPEAENTVQPSEAAPQAGPAAVEQPLAAAPIEQAASALALPAQAAASLANPSAPDAALLLARPGVQLNPAAQAILAASGQAATAARSQTESTAAGARSAGERLGETRSERRTSAADAAVSPGPTALGQDALASPAQPALDGAGERQATNAKAAEAGNPASLAAPARLADSAPPAPTGVLAPTQRGEASSRVEPVRADALPAATQVVPQPGSTSLPAGQAPASQVNQTFAPQLASASAAVQAEARINVPLDSPEFAPALGAQISLFTRDGVQTARLQLNPAEMGPITVQIALDGSAARVDFQADVAATRDVIEASLPALAGALQDAGLTLAGGGVFQHAPRQQSSEGQAGQQAQGAGRGDNAPATLASELAAPVAVRSRGLVDLVA